jgi:Zn-dependent protease with chaperone function
MAGAAIAGIAGVLLVIAVTRNTRIKQDAALGIILSVFFGFGLMLLTFFGGEIMWLSYQVGIKKLVESNGGLAEILPPFSRRFEFNKVMEQVKGITV